MTSVMELYDKYVATGCTGDMPTGEALLKRLSECDGSNPTVEMALEALRRGDECTAYVYAIWLYAHGFDMSGPVLLPGLDVSYPPIVYASMLSAAGVVGVLLHSGVDVNAVDSKGRSALYMATDSLVVRMLRRNGAKELCDKDMVTCDQDKVLDVRMDIYERMALCECVASYFSILKGPDDVRAHAQCLVKAWFILDYMLEHCMFSFLKFAAAVECSSLFVQEPGDSPHEDDSCISIVKGPEELEQFRRLSYSDWALRFHVPAGVLGFYNPVGPDNMILADLECDSSICINVKKYTLEEIDKGNIKRCAWGYVPNGHDAKPFWL